MPSNFFSSETWKSNLGLPIDLSANDDSDGDDIPLLVEYAFNLDLSIISFLPKPRIQAGQFIIDRSLKKYV